LKNLDEKLGLSSFQQSGWLVEDLDNYHLKEIRCSSQCHTQKTLWIIVKDNRGRRVIPFAHFINNDLEYLRGSATSRKYTTSVTNTKAADYGNIKWIEDLVPRSMWIQEPINYDKHALWGVSHWGRNVSSSTEDDDDDKDGDERDDDDDADDEEEIAKIDEQDDTERGGDDDEESESDEESDNEETREEESFDPIPRTPEDSEDDGNGDEDQGLRISMEERLNEEEEADELYRDVDINQGRGLPLSQDIEDSHVTLTLANPDGQQESSSVSSQFVTSMLNPTSDAGMESIFATASSPVAPLQTSTPIMTSSTIATISTISHAPIPPTTIPSEVLQNLPTFDSVFRFEDSLKSLEANFSEYIQTNQFAEAVSNISGIVHQYMNQQMNEAVRVVVQIQTDRLRDSYQRENDQFLRTIDENMKRIIKEQSVNAQLEAEVLTRSSHSSRTSYAVAADLSDMELKKILIEKMKGNKSIQRSDEQRNLYKALIEAYEADKIILDTYGETVTRKRRRDDESDKDEGPSAGSDRGSKRRREGKEPESASAPLQTATRSAGRSTTGSKSRQVSASEYAFAEEPVQTTYQMDELSYPVFETGADDQPIFQSSQHLEWFSQPKKPPTPDHFSNFIMNRLRVDTLTPELLAGPTFDLMKGSCTSLIELEYHLEEVYKAATDQLDWVNPEGQQYPHNLLQPLPLIPDNRGRHVIPFAQFINNDLEYLQGDWITVRRDNDKLYKFKEGDFKRMFTQSIIIQRRVEDLQLGVESYQKRLNLTKPDTYRSDLKRREAHTAYSNPRGFIYQNEDKKNRLMRIDELHKFSDGTLNDVRNALDDRLKGIRMQYL
nr:hypothetical protein [Tanacetum cinerariifolium]